MGDPALNLLPEEEVLAEEAGQQTTQLVLIEGGKDAAVGGEVVAGETAGESILAGLGTAGAATMAFLLVLLWPSKIAPDPPMDPPKGSTVPNPNPSAVPAPKPQATTMPCNKPDPCPGLLSDLRDAIDRNKRNFANKGMHGLKPRWQELITGPCGPGQMPYRVNNRGDYVKTDVWQNHVDEFNRTKSALRNRFNRALDAGCTIPDDLLEAAAEADSMKPPTKDQWVGDPNRPCTDTPPPPNWQGPIEPPSTRGL